MNSKISKEVWPLFTVNNGVYRTNLRKEHDGKWYFIVIKTPGELSTFLWEVYMFILFGEVSPTLKDPNNGFVFILDENQETEQERLLPNFINKKNERTENI